MPVDSELKLKKWMVICLTGDRADILGKFANEREARDMLPSISLRPHEAVHVMETKFIALPAIELLENPQSA